MANFLEEYTMLAELGHGGFAKVYKIRHNKLGYIRAVRVLNDIVTDENDRTYQKFLEECRTLLRLGNGNHPNIVHIYQPLCRAQRALVEMDFIDGCDIKGYIAEQKFVEYDEFLKLLTDISSALAYCHEEVYKYCMDPDIDNLEDDPNDGSKFLIDDVTRQRLIEKYRVIHNDLHTGNIMRRENGRYVLLDFGLAISGDDVVRSSRRHGGAPEFMAPEKWEDEGLLSTQSDVYSFGIILYNVLTGQVPFPYDKNISGQQKAIYLIGEAHRTKNPDPIFPLRKALYEETYNGKTLDTPDYPMWVEELIMKCLEKNPADRFANAAEMYRFVQKHLAATPVRHEAPTAIASVPELNEIIDELRATKSELQTLRDEMQIVKQHIIETNIFGNDILLRLKSNHNATSLRMKEILKFVNPDGIIEVAIDDEDAENDDNNVEKRVGDYYNEDGVEGVIFQLDSTGKHGKIVSTEEDKLSWCNSKQFEKKEVLGLIEKENGKLNTRNLLTLEESKDFPAFMFCKEYGHGWYLPAVSEILEIYKQINVINDAMKRVGATPLSFREYWTSTESNEITAQFVNLRDGLSRGNFKFSRYLVRAIHEF